MKKIVQNNVQHSSYFFKYQYSTEILRGAYSNRQLCFPKRKRDYICPETRGES